MKCIYIILLITFGLQIVKADDEVAAEPAVDVTEASLMSEKVKFVLRPDVGSTFITIVF